MNVIKKRLKLRVLFGIFILMMFCLRSFSYILLNGSGEGYINDEDGEKIGIVNVSMEANVIQGAGYFMEANSYIQSILNRVELQDITGIDFNELYRLVDRALENIKVSRMTYGELIQLAEVTPYNREFIVKLKAFDYRSFMTGMDLNSVVFNQVRGYLERGDITGTFKHTYSKLAAIEDLLKEIKNEISYERIPGLSLLWKLNETCAETSLFGSHAARIFHSIQ